MTVRECPECGRQGYVINSRVIKDHGEIYRRRQCESCGFRWSTLEVPTKLILKDAHKGRGGYYCLEAETNE